MTTLSALLVLGQAALLAGSWWIARGLRDGGRPTPWLLWPALAVSVAGAGPEVTAALSGAHPALADAAGVAGLGTMLVSELGCSGVAGHRAIISARRRASQRSRAIASLAAGDAAFAGGHYEDARQRFQEQIAAAQAAGDDRLLRDGLARVAWLDYVSGHPNEARSTMSRAAGGGVDEAVGSELVLLAGCLALAGGRLDLARLAIEDAGRMAKAAHDASQAAVARLALGCEHYLEGWTDSGRSFIEAHAEAELQTFDRGVAAVLVVALASLARSRGNDGDARAIAVAAEPLVAGNGVLGPLAAHAAAPEATPWLAKPSAELARLVAPAPLGAAAVAAVQG